MLSTLNLMILIFFPLLLLSGGCQRSPEDARKELNQLGIRWSQEAFIAGVEDSDRVVVELFLRAGMNPDAASVYGWTPLMHAALSGHTRIARTLIHGGASVNAKGDEGFTALSLAVGSGHMKTVRLLIDTGADVKSKDSDGWTVLMYAAERGHGDMVSTLLDKGAEVNVANNDGDTALTLAERKGHSQIAEMLRQSGATDQEDSLRAAPSSQRQDKAHKVDLFNLLIDGNGQEV